ncbi:chorismate synthase [Streptomyces sp. NPDC001714]|uniref:chorismate synthase n=1 Tax=Streptomyces sp. NPDC001714 TaxID=3364603 RepID=UPI0036C9ECA6
MTLTVTGVSIRTVHDVAGLAAVTGYFSDVWQTPRTAPPYPAEVLHSLVHAGGAVHAAYDGTRLAGAAVAVFGPDRDTYSLVAAADQGLGHAVKRAQRAWALDLGARTMRWTFDPLVGRNARFNLVKLGATGTEYLVDFYGPMADGVNDGDESDRLTVTWDLTADPAPPATSATSATPVPPFGVRDRENAPASHRGPDGEVLARRDPGDRAVWCRVPEDAVRLRAADPALALRWRYAVREVFTAAFAEGFRAVGMSRDGWYTLARTTGATA